MEISARLNVAALVDGISNHSKSLACKKKLNKIGLKYNYMTINKSK